MECDASLRTLGPPGRHSQGCGTGLWLAKPQYVMPVVFVGLARSRNPQWSLGRMTSQLPPGG